MRTINMVLVYVFGLIILFLLLSRAAEFNTIINTLGGFFSTETRNLQGYGPGGTLSASPATMRLNKSPGFIDPGWGRGGSGIQATGGLDFGSINLADWFGGGGNNGVSASIFG